MAEPTQAEMKAELKKYLLSEGATPAQASKLVKIVFTEVAKGKKAGEVLKQMGITFTEKAARPRKRVARPKKKSVSAEHYIEIEFLDTTGDPSEMRWQAEKAVIAVTPTGLRVTGINLMMQEEWVHQGLYEDEKSSTKVYPKDGVRFLKAIQNEFSNSAYRRVSEIKTR